MNENDIKVNDPSLAEGLRVAGENHLRNMAAGKRRELVRLCKRLVRGQSVSFNDRDWVDYHRAGRISIEQVANRGN